MSYSCKHLPTEVFEIDGITYWAADADGISYFRGDLVFNLTSYANVTGAMKVPELSNHFDIAFEELLIPWKDGSIPQVKPSFWKAMHEYALSKGYKDVGVHCLAGHGRTGTMLAAIMIAIGRWDAKESVDFIRDRYCKSAVETEVQCLYLQELDYIYNDREPSEKNEVKGSYSFRKGSYNGWSGHWMD